MYLQTFCRRITHAVKSKVERKKEQYSDAISASSGRVKQLKTSIYPRKERDST